MNAPSRGRAAWTTAGPGASGLERARPDIADPVAVPGIAPRPAARAIKHLEQVAGAEHRQRGFILGRAGEQRRVLGEVAEQGLGIMRGDDASGERDIGKVLPIGAGRGVGQG